MNPPDIDQALEFLAAVFGTTEDGNVWFSSLSPTGDVCSLASRDADDIEGFLVRHNDPDRGSYFCPSALREGAKGRSKDAVQFITGIHADIDFKDHDKPPAEIRRAVDQTALPASIIVESGGGLHCYWLFREGLDATEDNMARAELLMHALADHLGGDHAVAHSAALMRLPGTWNSKREAPILAHIVENRSAARYELEDIEEWLADARPILTKKATAAKAKTDSPFSAYAASGGAPVDVDTELAAMTFGDGEHGIHHTQTRVIASMVARGVDQDEIAHKVLEATKAAYVRSGLTKPWDWKKEQRAIHKSIRSFQKKAAARAEAHIDEGVGLLDFWAYSPQHFYIFTPTREGWPSASVNSRIRPVLSGGKLVPASAWLDQSRAVEQATWAPGLPLIIENRLVGDGGWIERKGVRILNLYRPPKIEGGDAAQTGPWLDHARKAFGDDAPHLIRWLAHRVQRPEIKINHALVLGGSQGIGKDSLLEPVKSAVGPWNFLEVSPSQLLGRFNGYLKSVILRISEARDLGDVDRYQFYDHLKAYTAAPPDTLRVDEKNLREHSVFNCTGVIITTNHRDGIYLPVDDRRHFVVWSDLVKENFAEDYWNKLWGYYENGGRAHVAAYLRELDLSGFDPKAPPPKTPAFWQIVDLGRASEDAELADILDSMGNPDATTLTRITNEVTAPDFRAWLEDRKNRRVIPHRLEKCGYVPVRNDAAVDGLWKINGKRQVVYARSALSIRAQLAVAQKLGGQ